MTGQLNWTHACVSVVQTDSWNHKVLYILQASARKKERICLKIWDAELKFAGVSDYDSEIMGKWSMPKQWPIFMCTLLCSLGMEYRYNSFFAGHWIELNWLNQVLLACRYTLDSNIYGDYPDKLSNCFAAKMLKAMELDFQKKCLIRAS